MKTLFFIKPTTLVPFVAKLFIANNKVYSNYTNPINTIVAVSASKRGSIILINNGNKILSDWPVIKISNACIRGNKYFNDLIALIDINERSLV